MIDAMKTLPARRSGSPPRPAEARWLSYAAALLALLAAVPARAATWPLKDGSHQMLQLHGDGSPASVYKFHQGVDILASGMGGEEVVAARGGKLLKKGADAGGYVTIEVKIGELPDGTELFEYDRYFHVSHQTALAEGETIAEGESIGKIDDTHFEAYSRHLHFEVLNVKVEHGFAAPITSHLNPLLRFSDAADRDPLGQAPLLADANGDGHALLVVASGQTNPPAAADILNAEPVAGDVDLIAEVRDPMHDSFLGASGAYAAGYYVEALFAVGVPKHDVRTQGSPYLLARFDDQWFADNPAGKFAAVYADSGDPGTGKTAELRVQPNDTAFAITQQYILTNTSGSDGRVANVDADQYWNTNARQDALVADDSSEANFAGRPDAQRNAEARFKDGDYAIHAMLADVTHGANDVNAGKIRLDNFTQRAGAALGGAPAAAAAPIAPLYAPDFLAYVSDFQFQPATAALDAAFQLGDSVGVFGEEFYPDLVMPAYIFPHRLSWHEDDTLADGFIASTLVQSDSLGTVRPTYAWLADQRGRFNVVIDYDRDGLFSWTLDGLGGFTVVPEPSAAHLLPAVCLTACAVASRRLARRLTIPGANQKL